MGHHLTLPWPGHPLHDSGSAWASLPRLPGYPPGVTDEPQDATEPTELAEPSEPRDPSDAMPSDSTAPRPRLSRRTGEELPPPELRALARERSEARRANRWQEADRLRALIEAQGWKVVDKGAEGRVVRAHPPDVEDEDGGLRYGWTGAVPEVEGDTDAKLVTVVVRSSHDADVVETRLALLAGLPPDTHGLVIVDDSAVVPQAPDAEIVRITGVATPGVTLVLALRRARGAVVVMGEGWPAEAPGERLPELIAALGDPTVGVAGWTGLASPDMRRFEAAGPASGDPVAVAWAGMTFRTTEGRGRGPIDEGFADHDVLAAWWSLVLRDEGDESPPRTARALLAGVGPIGEQRDRATRRDRYRIIDRFGQRYDLLTDPVAAARSRSLQR